MGFSRTHAVVAAFAILLLPALSWLDGSGQLAWTMFSRSGSYRLEARAIDAAGAVHVLAPSALAAAAGGPAGQFLAGADGWRYHDVGRITLERHLADVAVLGCRAAPAAAAVELTLFERSSLDAPVATRTARVPCGR